MSITARSYAPTPTWVLAVVRPAISAAVALTAPVVRRKPLTVGLAMLAASLALAPIGTASTWGWYGWLTNSVNFQCSWYTSKAVCSPYSTNWANVNNKDDSGAPDWLHTGFENGNAIRGIYLDPSTEGGVVIGEVFSAGANVQGESTCGNPAGSCPYGAYDAFPHTMYVNSF
jgi:hypothetical protein